MKETMTIHKALSELKTLDARLNTAIDQRYVVANKHTNAKIGGLPIAEFVKEVRENYQSARTLINRRNAIKRAVTQSNAATVVDINGEKFTVAEAIDMKGTGITYLRDLYEQLSSQIASAKRTADMENDRLPGKADEYMKAMYSGADLKNMADEITKVRSAYIDAQTMEVVDPLEAETEAAKLKDYIDSFMTEIDSALSVSNALTTITVEYETK